jgi:hypothetical protein
MVKIVLGLRAGAQLRHRLAHGRIVHPEPEGWGGRPRNDAMLARGGCRAMLFSLQMMLSALAAGEGLTDERTDDGGEIYDVPLETALVNVGLAGEVPGY